MSDGYVAMYMGIILIDDLCGNSQDTVGGTYHGQVVLVLGCRRKLALLKPERGGGSSLVLSLIYATGPNPGFFQ